jgi:hypothetical protein
MHDRTPHAAKDSAFGPDEPPTTPFTYPLGPLVTPTPPRSMKIRKINSAMLVAAREKKIEKPRAVIDDVPTVRPPPPPPSSTTPAPAPEPMFVVKAVPIVIVPPELSPPPMVEPPSPPAEREETPEAPSEEPAEKRRWPLRIALLVTLVAGELWFAHQTGNLRLPGDYDTARAMLVTGMDAR